PGPMGPQQVPVSNFFNDVWSSDDGVNWVQKTPDAGWEGRAGLSSIVYRDEIYVFGGSKNDDQSIVGPGGPERIYFNDVWKSSDDGATWDEVTAAADWEPRAGAAVVVKDDFIYLLGGEDGFTCDSGGPRCPPYFNDVWRTQDGENWELVTAASDWAPRPGHVAAVVENDIVLFGGFGLSADFNDPFKPSNPIDMWVSEDGAEWDLLSTTPWNASSPEQIKYDFDSLVSTASPGGVPSLYTFGGDRETFNPVDLTNYLNVDNDVWRFTIIPEPSTSTMILIAMVGVWGASAIRRT
ncbi:MAG: Kelch repeat-containing protein, partial [Bythopirellula sp.]